MIIFFRSFRKKTTIVSRYLKRFQRFNINILLKIINIIFLFDILKLYIAINDLLNNDANFSIRRNCHRKKNSKIFQIAKNKKIVNYYIIF